MMIKKIIYWNWAIAKKFLLLEKKWLNLGDPYKTLNELENELCDPPVDVDNKILDRVLGSIMGLAMGDAVGAHVEFRPQQFLAKNPVTDLKGGGTWGLNEGEVISFHLSVYVFRLNKHSP